MSRPASRAVGPLRLSPQDRAVLRDLELLRQLQMLQYLDLFANTARRR